MGHALYPSWWPSLTEDEQIEHMQRLQTEREFVRWLALRTRHFYAYIQVEGIQTILFKFWAFRVYTLNNLTPIRLFCVKGRFSGLSGIKTDHVWPEIRPLGFKGLRVFITEDSKANSLLGVL